MEFVLTQSVNKKLLSVATSYASSTLQTSSELLQKVHDEDIYRGTQNWK